MNNLTKADAAKAEIDCRDQRKELCKRVLIETRPGDSPADFAMCVRVRDAARADFAEFENLLTFPEVNSLFCRGFLHFGTNIRGTDYGQNTGRTDHGGAAGAGDAKERIPKVGRRKKDETGKR
jgi:hypothetical protein